MRPGDTPSAAAMIGAMAGIVLIPMVATVWMVVVARTMIGAALAWLTSLGLTRAPCNLRKRLKSVVPRCRALARPDVCAIARDRSVANVQGAQPCYKLAL